MTGDEKKGFFFVVCTGFLFSLEVIGFKWIFKTQTLSAEVAAFYGVLFSFLFVSPYFVMRVQSRERLKTTVLRDGKILCIGTFSNAIGILLYYTALRLADLGPSAVLIKSTALYNVLFGIFLLGERFSRLDFFGISLAILGIYTISNLSGEISLYPSLLILGSGFFFAIQSYLIKKFVPSIHGIEFAFIRLGLLSFFFFFVIFVPKGSAAFPFPGWTSVLYLGTFSMLGYFFGRGFYFEAHKYLPIGKLNAILLFEPAFLLFLGILLFGESWEPKKFLGTGFILLGLYLLIFHKRKSL